MKQLGCLFFVGSVLVNAHLPSMSTTFYVGDDDCEYIPGCSQTTDTQCAFLEAKNDDVVWDDVGCSNLEAEQWFCECNVQFHQPTSAFNEERDAEEDDFYEDDVVTPCGTPKEMLEWNDEWNVDGQQGTIDMAEKTIENADYFDCTANGGEWRAADGETHWPEFSGDKYCRVKFDFFGDKGPKRDPVDSFLCKNQCQEGSADCKPMEPWPKCTCPEGTAPDNWQDCIKDGNHQCTTCSDPTMTPVANRATNEIRCQPFDPYHLVECGRDPTLGMRTVPKAEFAPYSTEMCAYWVKQDELCEGDYFYSFNDLSVTDFSEQGWQDFYAKMQTHPDYAAYGKDEWEAEHRSFLEADLTDFDVQFDGSTVMNSNLTIHKQKQYGCWCRGKLGNPNTEYLWSVYPDYERQNETTIGHSGNTYKFNVDGEDNTDDGGPMLATDPAKGCPNFNYKIEALTSDWKCPKAEPKPIFGWILADTDIANGEGCKATTTYSDLWTLYGSVLNLPNGKYSFLCYASNVGLYKVQVHRQRSWISGGLLSVGTKFKHNMVGDANGGEEPLCGVSTNFNKHVHFKDEYIIDNENRPMWFVIRNWEFIDGRMYFLEEEQVAADYNVTQDPRWQDCSEKFTTRAPLTPDEISSGNDVTKRIIPEVVSLLNGATPDGEVQMNCNQPDSRMKLAKFMKQQAVKETKRGMVFTGPQLWGWYLESLSADEANACGSYEAVLAEAESSGIEAAEGYDTTDMAKKADQEKTEKRKKSTTTAQPDATPRDTEAEEEAMRA